MYHKKSWIQALMSTFIVDSIILPQNFLRLFGYTVLSQMFMIGLMGIGYYQFFVTMVNNLKPQSAFAISNNNDNNSGYNNTDGQYTNANNTQNWIDPDNNLKIHFVYLPEYPLAGNTTQLIFHVQSLQTGSNLKDLTEGITITNNLTTAKIDGIKDTNGAFSSFASLPVTNGVLSLSYRFLEEGTYYSNIIRFAFIPILTKKEDKMDDLDDSFKVVTASLAIRDILPLIAKANLNIPIKELASQLISLDGKTSVRIALDYMLNNGIRNIGIREERSAHDDVSNDIQHYCK
ncbi:MAG: hypothetical protein WBF33_20155 [Candidatus Nitrosopolaris sp.]